MELQQDQEVENTFQSVIGDKKISEDGESYRMVIEEQKEMLSYESLRQHLPESIFNSLCTLPLEKLHSPCAIDEFSMRMAFQNSGAVPPLTSEQMQTNLDEYDPSDITTFPFPNDREIKRKRDI